MNCQRCGCNPKSAPDWGRYAKNGRLHVLCPSCHAAVELRRESTADAKARGYRSAGHTPEYRREWRKEQLLKGFLPKLIAGLSAKVAAIDARVALDCQRAVKKAWRLWTPRLTPAEQYKKRYAANPEAERLRSTRYKHANPGKVAKWNRGRNDRAALYADGTLTRQAVGELFGAAKRCPYCGTSLIGSQKTMDHLDPLNLGGTHGISNVVICCRPCNIRKKDRPFTEWLTMVERTRQSAARSLYARVRGVQPEQESLTLAWSA